MINRSITARIKKYLEKKIVLLGGPRQSGKTTLSQTLFLANETQYLNYDVSEDRNIITNCINFPKGNPGSKAFTIRKE